MKGPRMSKRIVIPYLLRQSVKVDSLAGGKVVVQGSGFVCENLGQHWLVTNRHVLLNRLPESNEYFVRKEIPTHVRITWIWDDLVTDQMEIPLFDAGKPLWIEHPPLAKDLDLVAIPVPSGPFVDVDLVSSLDEDGPDVSVGDPVIVAGFPFGISGGVDGLPVAFSGILSSPIGFAMDQKPRFLIDSRTREGLSGSPVYYYPNSVASRKGASGGIEFKNPIFIGLYCGRVNNNSDLGYVIEAEEIARTIVHKRPGSIV